MEFADFVRRFAQEHGWKISLESGWITLTGLPKNINIGIRQYGKTEDGDLMIEFCSHPKEMPHDADVVESVAYRLLRRNATFAGYAHWAYQVQNDTFFLKVVRNILARDLDAKVFFGIVAAIVVECEFAKTFAEFDIKLS
jgi:hypothetical protein